jgi:hypothetical protein
VGRTLLSAALEVSRSLLEELLHEPDCVGRAPSPAAFEVGLFLIYPKKMTFNNNINPNGGGQECPPHIDTSYLAAGVGSPGGGGMVMSILVTGPSDDSGLSNSVLCPTTSTAS